VEADINFSLEDYEDDLKQVRARLTRSLRMSNLTKEEFADELRRQSTGFPWGNSKYRGVSCAAGAIGIDIAANLLRTHAMSYAVVVRSSPTNATATRGLESDPERKRKGERKMTWHLDMWNPHRFHADSAAT
jgi:hypothetical protein